MNQEKKAKIAALLKQVMPKGYKYSLSIDNHTTIVLTIAAAPIDLVKIAVEKAGYRAFDGHVQLNSHYLAKHFEKTEVADLFKKIEAAMYGADYYDNSNIMIDYHDAAYYVDVNLGKWNKPFFVVEN
jgi:hypothetical protein